MSTPPFRPVRAISPHTRDLVDAAVADDGRLVFRSAVLAHLAVQSGLWRVRQGERTWEEAGPDGVWRELPRECVDGVTWYSLDERWRWRSVLPVPFPRPEEAGPLPVPRREATPAEQDVAQTDPTRAGGPESAESDLKGDADEAAPAARPTVVAQATPSSGRSRGSTKHERPLLQAVADLTG